MKWVLRLIAVWIGLGTLMVALLAVHLAQFGSGTRGRIVTVGMAGTFILGAVATVQLWRLRNSGRHASVALFTFWGLLWVFSAALGKGPSLGEWLRIGILPLLTIVLFLPGARRACSHEHAVHGREESR